MLEIAAATVRDIAGRACGAVESREFRLSPKPQPSAIPSAMDPTSSSSPALSVALAVLAVLLGLTGFGVYQAFGPPSKTLSDPFDDHDD